LTEGDGNSRNYCSLSPPETPHSCPGTEALSPQWVDNIRMDLQEVGCGYMDWIGLAHDRDRWWMLVSAVMNLRVP